MLDDPLEPEQHTFTLQASLSAICFNWPQANVKVFTGNDKLLPTRTGQGIKISNVIFNPVPLQPLLELELEEFEPLLEKFELDELEPLLDELELELEELEELELEELDKKQWRFSGS